MQGEKDWNNPRFRSMMTGGNVKMYRSVRGRWNSGYNIRRRTKRFMRTRKYRRGGFGGVFNMKYVAGAALGYVAPVMHPLQDIAITALAVLPIKLPYNAKMIAQGYVLGRIVKGFVPSIGNLGGNGGGGTV